MNCSPWKSRLAGHDYYDNPKVWPGVRKAVDELLMDFRVSEFCYIYEKPLLLQKLKQPGVARNGSVKGEVSPYPSFK